LRKSNKKIQLDSEILQSSNQKPLTEASNIVELCFLMDCTGSMGSYISMCQNKINEIVDIITRDNPSTVIRIAFVGYRDHSDAPVKTLPFCTEVNTVKSYISRELKADGGGDIPEDICGGLLNAINLEWNCKNRLLILITDAPCHGNMYHSCSDTYPSGDPSGLIPEVLLSQLANKKINIFFAKIKNDTDKMTTLWENHLREYNPVFPLTIFSIQNDVDFVANITDAIATVIFSR